MAKRPSNSTTKAAIRAEEDNWRVQSDLSTLKEAALIRKDPKRMAAVQALAKEQLVAIAGLVEEGPGDAD